MSATRLGRRAALLGLAASVATGALSPRWAAASAPASALGTRLAPLWQAWKAVHMRPEGRVVDTFQNGASHSEGQGYGMILAEAMGDRDTFASLWAWTRAHLAIRESDALLAWRWRPGAETPVDDLNNASDGDLFCAWALQRAARRFGDPSYADASRALAGALAEVCLREVGADGAAERVLLPGAAGFEHGDHLMLNPSYAMPRALEELAAAHDLPALAEVAASARRMNDRLSQGGLPPDWVGLYDHGFGPAEGREDVFGYEALRVPLFEIWSGRPDAPAVAAAARVYDRVLAPDPSAGVPTRIARDGARVLERSADPGYAAIAALVSCGAGAGGSAAFPAFVPRQPYYPATLHLMTLVASSEAQMEC